MSSWEEPYIHVSHCVGFGLHGIASRRVAAREIQLAGQVTQPRPLGRIQPRHAVRSHHPAAHLQVGHEPAIGMTTNP